MKRKLIIGLLILALVAVPLLAIACEEAEVTPSAAEETTPASPAPEETIEISFATWAPESEPHVEVLNWFADELNDRTEGRVEVTLFLAAALGDTPELPENVQNGVADMAIICPTHVGGLMPIAELMSVPMLIPSAAAFDYIGWHLITEGLMSLEGTKILQFTGHEDIVLCTTDRKVSTLEDFKGLVLGTSGTWGDILAELSASEMQLPPPEIYTSVERGVVDGGTFGWSLPMTYNMEGLIKYICSDSLGNDPWAIIINQDKWDSLPSDIQVIMLELSREANNKLRVLVAEQTQVCYDHFVAEPEVEVYSFDPGEYEKLLELALPLVQEKAASMDAQGVPATEALEIILADLRDFGLIEE